MFRTLQKLVAIVAIALLIYIANPLELWEAFKELTWRSIAYLFIVAAALIYVSAYKWKLFITSFGKQVSTLRLFGLYLVGYFVNLILPSYVGGDFVRSYYIGKEIGQHEALSATILERYTGLVAMVALAFSFMWFAELTTWQIELMVILIALGLLVITVVALSPKTLLALNKLGRLNKITGNMQKIQDGLHLAKTKKGLLAKTLLLSFFYHLLAVANTIVCAKAIGWDSVPVIDLMVVLPLILLVGAIPLSPNGLGIQEGAFFFFLKGIGATSPQALAVALLLRAKSYVLALFGGLAWLIEKGRADTSPTGPTL